MLKDRDGNELHFGDVVLTADKPARAYRFAWESWHKDTDGKRKQFACFGSQSGSRLDFLPTEDGRIEEVVLKVEDKYRTVQSRGKWIESTGNGKALTICECCGAPIPIRTEVDDIAQNDNRFCYYCGARMAR